MTVNPCAETPQFDCSKPCTQSCGRCPTDRCWTTCVTQCIAPRETEGAISECEKSCKQNLADCKQKCNRVLDLHQKNKLDPHGDVCNHPEQAGFSCRRPCHDICSNCITAKDCHAECFMQCEYPKECQKICDNSIKDCHGECVRLSLPVHHDESDDSD